MRSARNVPSAAGALRTYVFHRRPERHGIEIVPTFCTPHLTLRPPSLDGLFVCRPLPRHPSQASCDMVFGMASRKVTITLDDEQVDQIRNLVGAGRAASVSGFVQHAVGVALDDVAGWGAMLAQALAESGGPLSADERAWADEALGVRKRRPHPAA